MIEKIKPVKDRDFYTQYLLDHFYCEACGHDKNLSRHHIVKFGRSDEATNLLVLCWRCHQLAEGNLIRCPITKELIGKLSMAICLTIKKTRSPLAYDPLRLTALYGATLPDLEPIPEWLVKEWKKRRRK